MTHIDAPPLLRAAIPVLQYASPIIILLYFIFSTTFSVCTLQSLSLKGKYPQVRRDVVLWLMISVAGSYALDAIVILVRLFVQQNDATTQSENVYVISSFIVWLVQVMAIADAKSPVWYTYFGNWIIGIFIELVLLAAPNFVKTPNSSFEFLSIAIRGLRIFALFALCAVFFGLRTRIGAGDDPERQSLLKKSLETRLSTSDDQTIVEQEYGSTQATQISEASSATAKDDDEDDDEYLKEQDEARDRIAKRLANDGNWWTYVKGFSIFLPYIWPVHNNEMKIRAALVVICLLSGNAFNVLIPRQLGIVTDGLLNNNGHAPWLEAAIYAALTFANSEGCIGWIQFWLWLPLEQEAESALQVAAYSHVMNLSSDFHDSKDPSDITQAIHQGKSITKLLETVCLEVVPMFINLLLAFAYLYKIFGPYMGLDTAITSLFYLYTTTKLVSMVSSSRRSYVFHWRRKWIMGYAGIDAWLTATYFNNISYETNRYNATNNDFKRADRVYRLACRVISATQGLVMTVGLLGGCFLAIYQVVNGTRTPGDFVMLLTYWTQLRGPLSFFSGMYKDMSECLMDAERMLELFQTKTTIVDKPTAVPLRLGKGEIRFDNVNYAYDPRKPTLKDVNFVIPGGSTVALVGETGGGKSTILKLIDRFYDIDSGSISIDGQDVRDITLKSLRANIGVVPQSPALFNETIMNNVRYARLDATDKEVHEACRAAAIHDKIMSFPDGYGSKIGRRGVKLSGGEQQRIAIARAILKQPEIILLDEATSAVDTETEQVIQEAFNALCKDRTTFIVAHRLSTIMKAARILVVKNGEIVEDGSHDDLIHAKGKYYDLWSKQIMVKPAEDLLISKSPQNEVTNVVNDIDKKLETTSLGKVLRTTAHSDHGDSIAGSAQNNEVPKLKPNAPEFVPQRLRTPTNAADDTHRVNPKLEKKTKVKNKMERKERKVMDDRKDETSIKQCANPGTTGNEPQRAVTLKIFENDGATSTSGEAKIEHKPRLRHPRYISRRHKSKSEPASRLQDAGDGTIDLDATADSSIIAPRRRISAPSGPSFTQDIRTSARGGRIRQTRHWRLKNKAVEKFGSGVLSNVASSGNFFDNDSDLPGAPRVSPAAGI